MTPSLEQIEHQQLAGSRRWDADDNRWVAVKEIIGSTRVTLGPQASDQYLNAPEHLAMVLARYRAAAALIGGADSVLEIGCGEGIGAGILAKGRTGYAGVDTDRRALETAWSTRGRTGVWFGYADALWLDQDQSNPLGYHEDAAVALDVIEHIPAEREDRLLESITRSLKPHGVCVIGTPSKHAEHLASPQSKAGHVNLYTPDRLHALMGRYFHVVQMLSMQDMAVHFGHPEMAHYLLAVGIGPRRD